MNVPVDFKKLKSIPIAAVLEKYGIAARKTNIKCPLPTHTSEKKETSFRVNEAENYWQCFSGSCVANRNGKKGGDGLDFVKAMEGCGTMEAARKMLEWFPQNGTPKIETRCKEPEANKPLAFTLKGISYHPYLEARGVSKDMSDEYGIGFFPGKGSMAGRIVIPIHNETGQLVAYAGRAVGNEEPRYKLPPGFHKHLVLWNLHRVKGEAITLVEGVFGALRVIEAKFPCVALMGSTLSPEQERLLRPFKFLTLLLDPDPAGLEGTKNILPRLAAKHYVRVAQNTKCPDEMTIEEVRNCLRYTCPT